MTQNTSLLCAEDLHKKYEDLTAVENVSFSIEPGEIFGLLGPNGAGKTTTISMISGILPPTSGQIFLNGHPCKGTAEERRLLGVVPQDLAVYLKLTGRENLEFFGSLYGLKGPPLAQRVEEMLELVGLTEHAERTAEKYSGGMKRRLNLAAGLMHSPQLLLLDEPTVGVDPQSRNHIFEGVRALNRKGLTVLYTSHYMEEVQTLCSRVGIMDRGRLIACDQVENLIAGQGAAIVELMLGADTLPEELLDTLRNIERVERVTEREDAPAGCTLLQVHAHHPERAMPALVSAVNRQEAPLLSLSVKQPNLEDVFLALTGKNLRD